MRRGVCGYMLAVVWSVGGTVLFCFSAPVLFLFIPGLWELSF